MISKWAVLGCALALVAGCRKNEPAAGAAARGGGFAVQVVAVSAVRQPVVETLPLVGNIVPNEMVEIKAEADGLVERIHFGEGQRVERGAVLLELDATRFVASLAQAEADFQLARANFERSRQLLQDKLISQQEHDQASSSFAAREANLEWMRRQLKDARLEAPFAGITGSRQVSPGQVITRNTVITWLVDLDTVKVEVNVPEKYLGEIKTGQPLEFRVAAYPGETFRGEVYFVAPQLDEATRTALVKARVANPGARLKGGMFASLDLSLRLKEDALIIPEPALVNNGDRVVVFVVGPQTNAVLKPVQIGLRLAGKAEVTSGLSPGELVIVEGVQKLRPDAPVRLAPAEAAAPYVN